MRQLVIRTGAMGDVLDATPIIARLKKQDPDGEIDVETQHQYVFWGNPDITNFKRRNEIKYDRIINLDMAYENELRKVPGVDCYSQIAFGDHATPHQLKLCFGRPPYALFDYMDSIAFHPARSWPSRTLPRELWVEIVNMITARGWQMIALASRQDWEGPWGPRVCDARDKLTLAQQAAVINASAAFLCSDNGMMAIGQTTKTPVVAMLTISLPFLAQRERNGKMGWGFYPITASVPCIGCGHRQAEPTKRFACEWANSDRENQCVTKFNVRDVVDKVISVARQHRDASKGVR